MVHVPPVCQTVPLSDSAIAAVSGCVCFAPRSTTWEGGITIRRHAHSQQEWHCPTRQQPTASGRSLYKRDSHRKCVPKHHQVEGRPCQQHHWCTAHLSVNQTTSKVQDTGVAATKPHHIPIVQRRGGPYGTSPCKGCELRRNEPHNWQAVTTCWQS
jgi:hypothetical protein